MSSMPQRRGLSKVQSLFKRASGLSAKTKIFAVFALVLLAAVITASAWTADPNQQLIVTNSGSAESSQQAGFVDHIYNFFGLSQKPATSPGDLARKPAAPSADSLGVISCDNAPDGLIACYNADADSNDSKGRHNGVWVGLAGYGSGKIGAGSFSLSGAGKVEIPNDEELNPANITVGGWVNLTTTDGNFALISKGEDYSLSVRNGSVVFSSKNGKGGIETLDTPFTGALAAWSHIAATVDGKAVTIFINGEEVASRKQAGFFRGGDAPLSIGSLATGESENVATGLADEVMIFGRALTGAEVKKLGEAKPDSPSNVTGITVAPDPVNEGAGFTTVTVTRDAAGAGSAITVNFTNTAPGGAVTAQGGAACVAGVDYVFSQSFVAFAANDVTPKQVTIQICDDAIAEGNETGRFTAAIAGSAETLAGSPASFVIQDNDFVTVTASAAANEGNPGAAGTYTFTVNRGGTDPVASAFSFNMTGTAQHTASTATTAQDYTQTGGTCGSITYNGTNPGTATVPANQASCTIIFTATTDDFVETNETIIFTVPAPAGNAGSTATTTINNDDNPWISVDVDGRNLNFPGTQYAEEDGADVLTYTFTRGLCAAASPGTPGGVGTNTCPGGDPNALVTQTANYTATGTATPGVDYPTPATSPTTVSFTGTATSATVTVAPTDDTIVEPDETVIFTVTAAGGGQAYNVDTTPGGANTATGVINDDDEDVTVTVTGSPVSEAGPGALSFNLTRVADSAGLGIAFNDVPVNPLADSLTVNFTLGGAAPAATCTGNVDYTVAAGAGTANVTYNNATCTGTVTMTNFDTTGVVVVTPVDDAVPENDENVLFTITAGSGGNVYGVGNPNANPAGTNSANGVITNEDFQVIVQVAPSSVNEDSGTPMVYTFTRIGQTATALCANFNVSGTASALNDYTTNFVAGTCPNSSFNANAGVSPGSISIPGGAGTPVNGVQANQANFTVTPNADQTVEPDETVIVQVDNPQAPNTSVYAPGNPAQATGNIINDDAIVSISVSPTAVAEDGVPNLVYTFTRSANFGPTLTVNYNVTGTADATDYTGTAPGAQQVTFAAGSPTATVVVDPTADSTVEPDETVILTVTPNGALYTVAAGPNNTATGTITNDDASVSVAVAPSTTVENSGVAMVYTFTRTGSGIANGLTVNYTTSGTANNADYTGTTVGPNVVIFNPGSATATVTVTPVGDTVVEPDETVVITVNNGTGYSPAAGPNDSATGTILNDDNDVSVTSVAPSTTTENSGTAMVYTFTRATNGTAATQALTVNYSTTGSATCNGANADFTIATPTFTPASCTGTVVIPANATTATISVVPTADTNVEGDETVIVTATAGTGYSVIAPSSQTGTIVNDDEQVSVAVSPSSVLENSGNTFTYTFSRTTGGALANSPLVINFNDAGSTANCNPSGGGEFQDYTVATGGANNVTFVTPAFPADCTGTVTILGNATSATVTVSPVPDTNVEGNETVTFNITAGAYTTGTASATGTITNDDTSFQVTVVGGSGNEGNANGEVDNGLTAHGSHATFVVTRTGDLTSEMKVDISTIPTGIAGSGTATSGPPNTPCGTAGIDYITDGKTLTFAATNNNAGTQQQNFFVAVCGDLTFEADETINVQLTNLQPTPANGNPQIVPNGTATWTILNDDAGNVLSFGTAPVVNENAGTISFTVNSTPSSGLATTFDFRTVNGTAASPSDYTGTNVSCPTGTTSLGGGFCRATIPANQGSVTLTFAVIDDGIFEGTEQFSVEISNPQAVGGPANPTPTLQGGGSTLSQNGTILDNENPTQYMISDVSQNEGNGGDNATTFNFTITRVGAPAQATQTVCYHTVNGNSNIPGGGPNQATGGPTASGTFDYTTIATNCVVFPGNDVNTNTRNVPVVVNGDVTFEQDETFSVILDTINGSAPGVSATSCPGNGSSSVPATGNPGACGNNSGSATGQGSGFVTNGGFSNQGQTPNAPGVGLGTILNDDNRPVLSVTSASVTEGTSATPNTFPLGVINTVTLNINKVGESQVDQTVTFTVAGSGGNPAVGGTSCTAGVDFIFPTNTAGSGATNANDTATSRFFAANINNTQRQVIIGICPDAADENDETLTLTLNTVNDGTFGTTTAAGFQGTNPGTATILDDDNLPVITVNDVTVTEGAEGTSTPATFTITRTGLTQFPTTVCYSTVDQNATGSASVLPAPQTHGDYTSLLQNDPANCVTIPANNGIANPTNTASVTVTVLGDNIDEANETFTLQLTSVNNATFDPQFNGDFVGVGTINDDDAAAQFAIGPVVQVEGTAPNNAPAPFFFRVTRTGLTQLNASLTYSTSPIVGGATGGTDCTVAGTDYIIVPGTTFTFTATGTQPAQGGGASGTNFVDVPVQVCQDSVNELTETFNVNLVSNNTNGAIAANGSPALGTINDDDSTNFVIRFPGPEGFEGNIGNTNFTFTIDRQGNSNLASSVCYVTGDGPGLNAQGNPNLVPNGTTPATAGSDYVALTGNANCVAFAANQSSANVTVAVIGDTTQENDETFFLRLISATNGATVGGGDRVGIIDNDDALPAGLEGDINRTAPNTANTSDGVFNASDLQWYDNFVNGTFDPDGNGPQPSQPITTPPSPQENQRRDVRDPIPGDGCLNGVDRQQFVLWTLGIGAPGPAAGPSILNQCPPVRPEERETEPTARKTVRTESRTEEAPVADAAQIATALHARPANAAVGGNAVVGVDMDSDGVETIVRFSLDFDPTRLSISGNTFPVANPDVTLGPDAPAGSSVSVNGTQVGTGHIGVVIVFNGTVPKGLNKRIVNFTFHVANNAPTGRTNVTFSDVPTPRQTVNGVGIDVPTTYDSAQANNTGFVTVSATSRVIREATTTTTVGGKALTPITIEGATGTESGITFTVSWNPAKLTISNTPGTGNPDVLPGNLPAGCSITGVNTADVANGNLGIQISCAGAATIAAGNSTLANLRFTAVTGPNGAQPSSVNPVVFSGNVLGASVVDAGANSLPVSFIPGAVNIIGPTAAAVSVRGRVSSQAGMTIPNARVSFTDSEGVIRTANTNGLGYFQVDGLSAGGTYVLTVSAKKFKFEPRSIQVSDNIADLEVVSEN